MYATTLHLTRQCNFDCGFCGRHTNDPAPPTPLDDLLAEARRAEQAKVITLSGGEPTLHPELLDLLRGLRAMADWRIVLETNGALLHARERLQPLVDAGLSGLKLMVPSFDAREAARITRVRSAGTLPKLVLDAAIDLGLDVEVVFPVGPWRQATLASDCDLLGRHFPGIVGVVFRLLREDWLPSRSGGSLAAWGLQASARAIAAAAEVCHRHGIRMSLSEGDALPYCVADGLEGSPGLFTLPPETASERLESGDLSPETPCAACALAPYCPGIPASRHEEAVRDGWTALTAADQRRWTDVLEPLTAPQHGLFDLMAEAESSGKQLSVYVLRLTPRCNIKCQHCWWTDWGRPDTPAEVSKRQIKAAIDAGVTEIAISGGEPTLMPELPELIAYARSLSDDVLIELQTNALRCASTAYTRALVDGGLDTAFCTFLASNKELYEEITIAPGTWEKVLQGLRNLQEMGVMVVLNYVINSMNYRDVGTFVRWFHREFPHEDHPNPVYINICAAQPINPDLMAMDHLFLPYPEMAPHLRDALDYCLDHGITVTGLNSVSGIPHCVLGGDVRCFDPDERQHSAESAEIFTYIDACSTCDLKGDACQGIRKNYLSLFGPEGFRPISRSEAEAHADEGSLWRRVPQKRQSGVRAKG